MTSMLMKVSKMTAMEMCLNQLKLLLGNSISWMARRTWGGWMKNGNGSPCHHILMASQNVILLQSRVKLLTGN